MMKYARLSPLFVLLLAISTLWLGGCTAAGQMTLPNSRPGDFTLGVVVYGTEDAGAVETRSARYIIDADGYLRASVGAGSSPSTYPKITRRLDAAQLDQIWDLVHRLMLGGDPGSGAGWTSVLPAGERMGPGGPGYLIEIRSDDLVGAWSGSIDLAGGEELVATLAGLAWIRE